MLAERERVRTPVARADAAFPWYIGAALVMAVGGGFLLAVLLPLAAALEWDWGVRWRALVQAHGHLQVMGWAGLFVTGMGFRLVPRFAGRPLRLAWTTTPALALLLVGLIGRAVAQPWLDVSAMRLVLSVSALAELVGAGLFAAAIIATLAPSAWNLPAAPLMMLGATGLVAQAGLGALWLAQIESDAPAIPPDRDGALVTIQFFGFMLPFVLGVSLRALPVFFAHRAPRVWQGWAVAGALSLGTALYALVPLAGDDQVAVRVAQGGALLIAAALACGIALTGVWRRPERLRPSARRTALLLRTAYVWLALAALVLGTDGFRALWSGAAPAPYRADAVRHLIAVGTVTTLIVGMAQLVLPWLAMRRPTGRGLGTETWLLWGLLTAATALRVAGALLEGAGMGAVRFHLMAAGGVAGICAVAFFGLIVLRAARAPKPILLDER